MKRNLLIFCMAVMLLTACNMPSTATPASVTETPIVVPTNTTSPGGIVSMNNVSFSIPLGVATDALSEMVPAVTDVNNSPGWDVAPDHIKFTLTGYQVPDKFHEPQIRVYPAEEYAKLNPAAAEQIEKLKTIIAGTQLTYDAMPVIPFFNAQQQIAAKMQVINFQSGRGIRFLTQYAQYLAPINNFEIFYHFQGLTSDGKYYVIAVLPVESSILAENDQPDAPVPPGGVPVPMSTEANQPVPDPAYYEAVTKALDAMYEDSFNPSLFQLDALIQSLTITP